MSESGTVEILDAECLTGDYTKNKDRGDGDDGSDDDNDTHSIPMAIVSTCWIMLGAYLHSSSSITIMMKSPLPPPRPFLCAFDRIRNKCPADLY